MSLQRYEYYTNSSIIISASYFNKNYEFDTKAKLVLSVLKEGEAESKKIPMLLKGSFYEAEYSDLTEGAYRFTVSVQGKKIKEYGEKLSLQNNGQLVFPNQVVGFIKTLVADKKYKPIIKYSKEQKSLIHWQWLLGIVLALFGLEWFLRKYNGLI